MKKLFLAMAVAAMTMMTACSGSGSGKDSNDSGAAEASLPEKFEKPISSASWANDITDSFKPESGVDAVFEVGKVEGDSVSFTTEISVSAKNTTPVNNVKKVECGVYAYNGGGSVNICENAPLASADMAAVLEMCKKADPKNVIKVKFDCKTTKALMDTLVNCKKVSLTTVTKMD